MFYPPFMGGKMGHIQLFLIGIIFNVFHHGHTYNIHPETASSLELYNRLRQALRLTNQLARDGKQPRGMTNTPYWGEGAFSGVACYLFRFASEDQKKQQQRN